MFYSCDTGSNSVSDTETENTSPVAGESYFNNSDNLVVTTVSPTTAVLNWSEASDAESSSLTYYVYYSTTYSDVESASLLANLTAFSSDTDITSCTVSGLSASTTYYFNVIAEDSDGSQAVYDYTSGKTTATTQVTDLGANDAYTYDSSFYGTETSDDGLVCFGDTDSGNDGHNGYSGYGYTSGNNSDDSGFAVQAEIAFTSVTFNYAAYSSSGNDPGYYYVSVTDSGDSLYTDTSSVLVAEFTISSSATNWDYWTTIDIPISGTAGQWVHIAYYTGGGANCDYIQFNP
jgi:hypothetical protein